GAQEENIFRRTNYYISLDYSLDQNIPYIQHKRSKCDSNGKLEGMSNTMYPIDEFGAIYTNGITIFRDTEDKGYELLSEPLYNMSAIALPAYRNPKTTNNHQQLIDKYAVGTRKKIENLFAIAYKNGHDSLVLSALGCGAFHNPLEHIALIFKNVIEQYAGFFKEIIFAIIDDHNTKKLTNPEGNYIPFKRILDGEIVKPSSILKNRMMIGPYKISNINDNKLAIKSFKIGDIPPCPYAAKCEHILNYKHCREFLHPSICPYGNSCTHNKSQVQTDSRNNIEINNLSDYVHEQFFVHRFECKHGGKCELANKNDQQHLDEYYHPEFCSAGGHCSTTENSHLLTYRHVPICEDGLNCNQYLKKSEQHCKSFRHCKMACDYRGNCIYFNDTNHLTKYEHPFNQPCPFTPYSCKQYIKFLQYNEHNLNQEINKTMYEKLKIHYLKYSHVCSWGRNCTETKSEEHMRNTIHIPRKMCSDLDKCNKLIEDDHLNSFSHPNIRDIRLLCDYSTNKCKDRNIEGHCIKYRHRSFEEPLGVAKSFALNRKINFTSNQNEITNNIKTYYKKTKIEIKSDILNWIRSLQPVHRCTHEIFESIIVHGHVMSRSYMNHLKDPNFVADAANEHNDIRRIVAHRIPSELKLIKDYIFDIISKEYINLKKDKLIQLTDEEINDMDNELNSKPQAINFLNLFKPNEIDIIRSRTIDIAHASITLHKSPLGIGYKPDQDLGTHQHVFSILGPHTGQYYGDIVIVFKHELMLHPDANFTVQAATTFNSGNTYKFRPWVKDPGIQEERWKQFHSSKLHCSIEGYEYSAALELMATTGLEKKQIQVELTDIINRWTSVDSHHIFEAHLPQLIPLNYIDYIYMPKNIFESLSPQIQHNTKQLFRNSLTITENIVSLTQGLGSIQLPDPSRINYQNYIIEQLLNRIKSRIFSLSDARILSTLYSITISIPPTSFKTQVTIPETISKYLSKINRKKNGDDCIYIYFKALKGDFMIILTNDRIDTKKTQQNLQCLTCYVAPIPIDHDTDDCHYPNPWSYINNNPPSVHEIVVEKGEFKVGTNLFHQGCNTDDFISYCLKIKRNTGEVSLIHCGANSIYNHIPLNCTFSKSDIDLTSLEYIHLAAGSQIVAFQNVMIKHQQIDEFHTSYIIEYGNNNSMNCGNSNTKKSNIDSNSTSTHDNSENKCTDILPLVKDLALGNKDNDDSDREKYLTSFNDSVLNSNDDGNSNKQQRLIPCKDSINCLIQYSQSDSHNSRYSHPCRFSELCNRINDKEHTLRYTHIKNDIKQCTSGQNCTQIIDPIHRSQWRHIGLPDFLIPCRFCERCKDRSIEHNKRYSHGELVKLPQS
ncbi:unnamed protein product, partial [Didymodactylos carnosus]